jgi:hypothetical protein
MTMFNSSLYVYQRVHSHVPMMGIFAVHKQLCQAAYRRFRTVSHPKESDAFRRLPIHGHGRKYGKMDNMTIMYRQISQGQL